MLGRDQAENLGRDGFRHDHVTRPHVERDQAEEAAANMELRHTLQAYILGCAGVPLTRSLQCCKEVVVCDFSALRMTSCATRIVLEDHLFSRACQLRIAAILAIPPV